MEPITKDIEIIRGDTFATGVRFYIPVFSAFGQSIPDNVFFICYGNAKDDYIFNKSLGNDITFIERQEKYVSYKIRIAPEDTRYVSPGKYLYEIKLVLFEEKIRTVLRGVLTIIPEVVKVE